MPARVQLQWLNFHAVFITVFIAGEALAGSSRAFDRHSRP